MKLKPGKKIKLTLEREDHGPGDQPYCIVCEALSFSCRGDTLPALFLDFLDTWENLQEVHKFLCKTTSCVSRDGDSDSKRVLKLMDRIMEMP